MGKKNKHLMIDGVNGKECCHCKQWRPLEMYGRWKYGWDGLNNTCKDCQKQRNAEHKEEKMDYLKNWRNQQWGKAVTMYNRYIRKDREYGRIGDELPEDYINPQWIIENIFTKPCAHIEVCGCMDWRKLGCNRLDNSKPHIKSNVEPCCKECNDRLAAEEHKYKYGKQVDQIDPKTGEVLASYPSSREAARVIKSGHSNINRACDGGYFRDGKWLNVTQCKGYIWKRPLI